MGLCLTNGKRMLHEKGKCWCIFLSQHEWGPSRQVTNLISVCAILFGIMYFSLSMFYLLQVMPSQLDEALDEALEVIHSRPPHM